MNYLSAVKNRYKVISDYTPDTAIDKTELKKFLATVKQKIKASPFGHYDIDVELRAEDQYIITVGDLVADKDSALDQFLEFLTDMFWYMKIKKTYKTIWPNWESTDHPGEFLLLLKDNE